MRRFLCRRHCPACLLVHLCKRTTPRELGFSQTKGSLYQHQALKETMKSYVQVLK